MSTTAGQLAGGLIIPVVAGVMNGSWNAAFSPAANLAVGKATAANEGNINTPKKVSYDLCHHHAWVLFQFYGAIANIILCLFWAGGPARVSWIVSEASVESVMLVSVFGVLMGMGICLLGEACRIAGVGMGTNLTIGILMILGTLLPLALNNQVATPSGGVILAGLAIAAVGLFFSMKSLQLRDGEDIERNQDDAIIHNTLRSSSSEDDLNFEIQFNEDGDHEPKVIRVSVPRLKNTNADEEIGAGESATESSTASPSHSTFTKIIICVISAVLCSTLQFAFVFGGELINLAGSTNGPGTTPESGLTAIIWLFVIPLSTVPNIIFALYKAKDISIDHLWKCPPSRHFKIFFSVCLPWIGHINLYGLAANLLLPPNIAAAVAWPILMMTTVAWGMILSIYLGEWTTAPTAAATKQKIGLGLMLLGVTVVMASVALD